MPNPDLPTAISPGDPGHIGHHDDVHGLVNHVDTPFDVPGFGQGIFSARPAAPPDATMPYVWFATDQLTFTYWNGAAWYPAVITIASGEYVLPAAQGGGLSDRVAIQTVLNAAGVAGGGIVRGLDDVYLLDTAASVGVTVPDNVRFLGPVGGTMTLRLIGNPAAATIVDVSGSDNWEIDHMKIDGDHDGVNTTVSAVHGIAGAGATNGRIGRGVIVDDCSLHDIILHTASNDNVVDWPKLSRFGSTFGGACVIFNGSLRNEVYVRVDGLDRLGSGFVGVLIDASSTGGGGTRADHNTAGGVVRGCGIAFDIEDSDYTVLDNPRSISPGVSGIDIIAGQDDFIPKGTRLINPTVIGGQYGIRDGGRDTMGSGEYLSGQSACGLFVEETGTAECSGNRHDVTVTAMSNVNAIGVLWRGTDIRIRARLHDTGTIYKGCAQVSGATSSGNVIDASFQTVTTTLGAVHAEDGTLTARTTFVASVTGDGVVTTAGCTGIKWVHESGTVSGTLDGVNNSTVRLPAITAVAAFSNSWVNAGGGEPVAGYVKDDSGFVHLSGRVKNGTVGAAMFNLGAGHRPSGVRGFPVVANSVYGLISVAANGNVVLEAGSNAYVLLDGVTFKAEL